MMRSTALAILVSGVSSHVLAQATPRPPPPIPAAKPQARPNPAPKPRADDDEEATVSELVIRGGSRLQPGAVVGDIKPELQLAPADIRAYGVSTVTELLDELAPQTRSDRGRGGEAPVVLLNGRRISGFNEIRDIPTEAILRVDILPEEVALKYGYSANQRVVNIVLRRRFRAHTLEGAVGGPTAGGQESDQEEFDELRLRGDNRYNLDLKYQHSTNLLESDRDLTPLTSRQAFDLIGDVRSFTPGSEIDPALSAQVGRPVIVAGVPLSAQSGAPSLADFAATAEAPNVRNTGRYRTLQPQTEHVSANAVISHNVLGGVGATFNGTLDATHSESLLGLAGASLLVPAGDPYSPFHNDVVVDRYAAALGPLRQTVDGWTGHLGATFNKDLPHEWRLSLTGAYDHGDSLTDSDAGADVRQVQALLAARSVSLNPFGALPALSFLPQAKARTMTDSGDVQFLANGPLMSVPAGKLYVSVKFGDTESAISSKSLRFQASNSVDLSRNDLNAQANFDLPVASRKNDVLPMLGELSLNLNAAADQLSDFGALNTLGYGLKWRPVTGVTLIVSHTHDQAAPSVAQLGGAAVQTAGVRILDFQTGRTVDVTEITGGNRALVADDRDVLKIGLTLRPFSDTDFTVTANYVDTRIDNPIVTFPAATAQIEAAFPQRFIRDAAGDLIEVDYRPVNYASEQKRELRWGFNYSKPIGPMRQPPPFARPSRGGDGGRGRDARAESADAPRASPGADGPPVGGPEGRGDRGARGVGGGRSFGQPRQEGRLQIAVYHTIFFQDDMTIRPDVPKLDLLDGAAAGKGGGQPRHEVEAQLGLTERGLGARLSADWTSGTTIRGGTGLPTDDLSFSDIAKVNLRLFADLGQQRDLVAKHPFFRGSRLSLAFTNLLDAHVRVRDATGATPLNYQAAYLDPEGRVVRLGFRKLFF